MIVLQQMIVLFIIMMIGFWAFKKDIIDSPLPYTADIIGNPIKPIYLLYYFHFYIYYKYHTSNLDRKYYFYLKQPN